MSNQRLNDLVSITGFSKEDASDILDSILKMSAEESMSFLRGLLGDSPLANRFIESLERETQLEKSNALREQLQAKSVQRAPTIWDNQPKRPPRQEERKDENKKEQIKIVKPRTPLDHIDNMDIAVGSKETKNGRIACECQAQIHPLINNCVSCGRVVCAYEGIFRS